MIQPTIWYSDLCPSCDHRVFGRSSEALTAAIQDHVQFVNATKDKATDEHFAELRIDRLVD